MTNQFFKRFAVILLAFAIGVAVGAVGYKYLTHKPAKPAPDKPEPYARNCELLRDGFKDELISAEPMVNPLCTTPEDVGKQIDMMFSIPASSYADACRNITVGEQSPATNAAQNQNAANRLSVTYRFGENDGAHLPAVQPAWAYSLPCAKPDKPTDSTGKSASFAVFIIPGTGVNESSRIARGDKKDYHGDIAALCRQVGDTYVLVKPNEDFLAIHDGKAKLSYVFVTATLLNHGKSYSAKYLCDALAVVKYLQSLYCKVYVVGLSQGGTAALYTALQAKPTGAIVASGFSMTREIVDPAGFNQIILPGMADIYSPHNIRELIRNSPTRFLFTYGKTEQGSYRVEAEEGTTQKYLAGLANVKFTVHEGGHAFPRAAVLEFLSTDIRR